MERVREMLKKHDAVLVLENYKTGRKRYIPAIKHYD